MSRWCRNAFLIYLFLKVSQFLRNSGVKASNLTSNVVACKLIVLCIHACVLKTEWNFRRSWIYTLYLLATVGFPFSELGIMSYCLLAVADLTIDASSRTLQCYIKLTRWFAPSVLLFISFMNRATSLLLRNAAHKSKENVSQFPETVEFLTSANTRISISNLNLTNELMYSRECILYHVPYPSIRI